MLYSLLPGPPHLGLLLLLPLLQLPGPQQVSWVRGEEKQRGRRSLQGTGASWRPRGR